MCSFKSVVVVLENSHVVHLWSYSPEWVLWCLLRALEYAVEFSHWLQLYDFSSICFAILCTLWWHVFPKIVRLIGRIFALWALVWFLPSVNEEVGLQMSILIEWLVALRTVILLDSVVCLLMIPKAFSVCKSLWTSVTWFQIFHPCWTNVPLPLLADF